MAAYNHLKYNLKYLCIQYNFFMSIVICEAFLLCQFGHYFIRATPNLKVCITWHLICPLDGYFQETSTRFLGEMFGSNIGIRILDRPEKHRRHISNPCANVINRTSVISA